MRIGRRSDFFMSAAAYCNALPLALASASQIVRDF